MKKLLFISVLFFCAALQCYGQENNSVPTIKRVFKDVENCTRTSPKVTKYQHYEVFDFKSFKPLIESADTNSGFKIGCNDLNQIVELIFKRQGSAPINFRMMMYYLDSYRIITYEKMNGVRYMYSPVVFVTLMNTNKSLLINLRSQFEYNSQANNLFEGAFPIGKFKEISAIMILNEEFLPTQLLRFSSGEAVISSEIVYGSNDKSIDHEIVYMLNIPTTKRSLRLKQSIKLNEIEDFFDYKSSVRITAQPDINKSYRDIPLWNWGGSHFYK